MGEEGDKNDGQERAFAFDGGAVPFGFGRKRLFEMLPMQAGELRRGVLDQQQHGIVPRSVVARQHGFRARIEAG